MATGRLYESAPVILNASGNGVAKVGPLTARETWHPENAHVSVSTNVNESVCKVYVGSDPSQQNFRDATFTGSSGDGTDKVNADTVKSGAYIWAVWSGGDVGSQAILTVTGTKEL